MPLTEPPATATAAEVVAPLPRATELASLAVAPLPNATLLAAVALATGPMATLSVPVALLSARVELLWKYLIPAPLLTTLLKLLPKLVTVVSRPSTRVSIPVTVAPRSSTAWLVANSWLPLMASVLAALNWPAATLVTCRSAPTLPTLSTPVGAAPAKV